ncbi:pimeloyl-ACP methyl ester carboxylesterase [Kribbella antiqua]|uniref:Pimeloyl-ACP methyl ester carboxylesterase n=1 Tax=Kribbella antiqua TaxID=2512217 RepID=A0A4R2IN56_9ACTN|nr:alpha/beta hydrolase [Kribbella antiqua]TCO45439.1 pimeloyl-ACP methyl ester carboxylesterase [Kribbella antiqua]
MTAKTVNKLAVPGATLHYEITGSGPVLLLIPGGGTDAGIFDGIVGQLAADYTVVAYDPRGNSRSPYDGEPTDERVDQSAEDALALITEVGRGEPAYVFGSSSGAITGLELITRWPDRVRMLVAHEPPAVEVLPDAEDARAFFEDVYDTYHRDGLDAADLLFGVGTGMDQDELPPPEDLLPEFLELFRRIRANAGIFYEHKLLPYTRYEPDLAALEAVADRIVPAAGLVSAEYLPGRPIQVIADHLGWPVVTFPGGHVGYSSHPVPFATLLARVLEAEL